MGMVLGLPTALKRATGFQALLAAPYVQHRTTSTTTTSGNMRLVSAIFQDHYPFDQMEGVKDQIHTTRPDELREGDVLIVWGGEDISPALYNKPKSRYSGADSAPSRRDAIEWALMKRAKDLAIPIIGVCRGGQMLCALAGGFLVQHIGYGHGGRHVVTTPTGYEFITNSLHHQMMYPWDVPHEMLASIKPGLAKEHFDVDNLIEIKEEPEFVYFPEVRGFAIQWHPEMMAAQEKATDFIFKEFYKRV